MRRWLSEGACKLGLGRTCQRPGQNWQSSKPRFTPASLLFSLELQDFWNDRWLEGDWRFRGLWEDRSGLDGREWVKCWDWVLDGCTRLGQHNPHPLGALLPCFYPMTGCLGGTTLPSTEKCRSQQGSLNGPLTNSSISLWLPWLFGAASSFLSPLPPSVIYDQR